VPQVRSRPVYPLLREKRPPSDNIDAVKCPKYYNRSRKAKTLTAGAMVFLCRHRFYIGFHMFPTFESVNDVFSTMFTRFKECPQYCVADNNCHAADYCTLREFKFFENCRFMIDDFHSNSHKGCSVASHAKHYRADVKVGDLNTSYPESANNGMGKIGNSTAYMSESHAIMTVQTYVCMSNRKQHQKLDSMGEERFLDQYRCRQSR
ncbi:hypothetical protein BC829DRAFT_361588, partial [Chytridium lagenaria]